MGENTYLRTVNLLNIQRTGADVLNIVFCIFVLSVQLTLWEYLISVGFKFM
jgi:hypothetical protein